MAIYEVVLPEVMSVRQAAEYLSVSKDTLYKYVQVQKLPCFKLGNRWRFKKSLLDRWMEEQCNGSAKPAGQGEGR